MLPVQAAVPVPAPAATARSTRRFLVSQVDNSVDDAVNASVDCTNGGCRRQAYHWITLPGFEDPDFSRQTGAYNWFFHSPDAANHRAGKAYISRGCEADLFDEEVELDREKPVFEHPSLWAFFENIGFDRRDTKYA